MRTIVNLKQLNKHVTYQHFKMESLSDFSKSFSQTAALPVKIRKLLSAPCLFITDTKSILNLCRIKSSTNI